MIPKIFVATKAFITHAGKILVLRESSKYEAGTNTNKFDVVGGRVEPGEKWSDCLLREIKEETGLSVKIGKPFFVNEWRPVVKGEQWQIVGIFFECEAENENVVLSQDHDAYKWVVSENFRNDGLIENLHPAFEAFLKNKK